jgi:choline kinase
MPGSLKKYAKDFDIVIPAAGQGRRMGSCWPKALVRVGKETIISRQIRLLSEKFPLSNIIVVGGYEVERLRKSLPDKVCVIDNKSHKETNVANSIFLGLLETGDRPVLIVYGDLVFNKSALSFSLKQSMVVVHDGADRENEVGCVVSEGSVSHFSYGLSLKWAQICFLEQAEKQIFMKVMSLKNSERMFGYEILNRVIDLGGNFSVCSPAHMKLCEIDVPSDIGRANKIVKRG